MGQFLVIQGKDERTVRTLFHRGLSAFDALCGLKPTFKFLNPTTAVAGFPRSHARTDNTYHNPAAESGWACSGGTVLFAECTGSSALARLWQKLPQERPFLSALADTEGQFALAFGSGDDLVLTTDKLGTLHSYIAQIDDCAVASSSSMVLAALKPPAWNMVSCREFLATGTVFEQRTLFAGIEKLPPATMLRFRFGREQLRTCYWNLAEVMYDRAEFRGNVEDLAEALKQALLTVSRSFSRPLMDLTGGFDSRALLAAMLNAKLDFGLVVHGPEDEPDVIAAKNIARRLGLHLHHESRSTMPADRWRWACDSLALTDGEADLLAYGPVYEGHARWARDFDVTVNGSNGEICKGYWWELLFPFTGRRGHFDERRVAAGRFAWQGDVQHLLAERFDDDLAGHFAGVIKRANAGFENHPNTAKMDNIYLTVRMQRWQGRLASATSRIWPCISPFMFRRPMESALSASPHCRVRHRMSRRLIEHLHPALAAIPLADGSPAQPLRLSTAHRFWPLGVRAVSRSLARLPGFRRTGAQAPPPSPIIGLAEVRELLRPSRLQTAGLYDARFLAGLEGAGPPRVPETYLGRMLTLEALARAVSRGASAASTAVGASNSLTGNGKYNA